VTAVTTVKTVIERELRAIWDARPAEFTPGRVVEAATPEDHPLHGMFEWDNDIAGPAYRCAQAAQLIRSVKITLTTENGQIEDHRVRAWLPARYAGGDDAEPGSYVPTTGVQSPEQRQFMLRQMKREALAFQRRYSHLSEFWSVIDELAAGRAEDAG
jgi:hypothetical protein